MMVSPVTGGGLEAYRVQMLTGPVVTDQHLLKLHWNLNLYKYFHQASNSCYFQPYYL